MRRSTPTTTPAYGSLASLCRAISPSITSSALTRRSTTGRQLRYTSTTRLLGSRAQHKAMTGALDSLESFEEIEAPCWNHLDRATSPLLAVKRSAHHDHTVLPGSRQRRHHQRERH